MKITPEALLEACYPLGDRRHSRETKRRACQLVMLERLSYRAAAREVGAHTHSVINWVDECEARLRIAQEAAEGRHGQAKAK